MKAKEIFRTGSASAAYKAMMNAFNEAFEKGRINIQDVETHITNIERMIFNVEDYKKLSKEDKEHFASFDILVSCMKEVPEGTVVLIEKTDWETKISLEYQQTTQENNDE